MSTGEVGQELSPEPSGSNAGVIVALGIVALGVVWTYIFFGQEGVGWWAKAGATAVIFPTMFWAWRWRRRRIDRQLELMQRWAEQNDAKAARGRRRPA